MRRGNPDQVKKMNQEDVRGAALRFERGRRYVGSEAGWWVGGSELGPDVVRG